MNNQNQTCHEETVLRHVDMNQESQFENSSSSTAPFSAIESTPPLKAKKQLQYIQ